MLASLNGIFQYTASFEDLNVLAEHESPVPWQPGGLGSIRDLCALGSIRHSMARQLREGIVPLCSALGLFHLKSCLQFCVPQAKKDIKLLENAQRRATKMVKGCIRRV